MSNVVVPIILAGGTGSRLWPLSRESYPKQFLNLLDDDKLSLLQKTYNRIKDLENLSKPIVICNEEHRFIVGDQMRKIKTEPLEIILEPSRRNTTPAITVAALKAIEYFKNSNKEPILLILSSDHQIQDIEKFKRSIRYSLKNAKKGKLIIFGVLPNFPSTGYGYIKSKNELNINQNEAEEVEKFIEKPDKELAKLLFSDKKYSWNSGMFVFKATEIIKEIQKYTPETFKNCQECLNKSIHDLDFLRLDKESFSKCSDISIDVSIFENTKKAFVLPLDCGWNDIGSWESLWDISKKDTNGNSIEGNVLVQKTKNSFIRTDGKLTVTIGLKDLIVIDTSDALFISNKKNSQDVKNIVSTLNNKGFIEGRKHKKIYRPWGYYLSLKEEKNWQIKKIEVNPGASLSLQKHRYRSEHWIVVQGKAKVQINSEIKLLSENESTYIPIGYKHRLSNPGQISLIMIEIQCGSYLGEDDIIRFEDKYGRDKN